MRLERDNVLNLFDLLNPDTDFRQEFSFEGYTVEVQVTAYSRGFLTTPAPTPGEAPGILHAGEVRCSWDITSDTIPSIETQRYDKHILACHIAAVNRMTLNGVIPLSEDEDGNTDKMLPCAEVLYVQIGNDNVFAVAHTDSEEEDGTDGHLVFARVRNWTEEHTPPWLVDPVNSVRLDYGNVTGSREILNHELELAEDGFMSEVFDQGVEAAVYANLEPKLSTALLVYLDLENEEFKLSPIIQNKDSNNCIMCTLVACEEGFSYANLLSDEDVNIRHLTYQDVEDIERNAFHL
jgi:hypothetical protein